MLDYRLLTFINLYQTMNYTKTAKILEMTQPAVTQHIKYLEHAYGVKLFNYSRKKLSVSKEGEYLYSHAKILLNNSLKLHQDILSLKSEKIKIRIGSSLMIARYYMPTIINYMQKYEDRFEVDLKVGKSEEIIALLQDGIVDLAFVDESFDFGELCCHSIKKEELAFAVAKKHPLASKSNVLSSDIIKYPFYHTNLNRESKTILKHALANNYISIERFDSHMEIDDEEAIKCLIKSGVGIGLVYQKSIKDDEELVALKIKGIKMVHQISMVYLNETINRDQFQAFFKSCEDAIKSELK